MTVPFAVDAVESAGVWVVRVSGEVDIATAPELTATFDAVIAAAPSRVLVELEPVTFLDSSGIRALVLAQRHVREAGGHFVIDGMSDAVKHVLEISGVLDELSRTDD